MQLNTATSIVRMSQAWNLIKNRQSMRFISSTTGKSALWQQAIKDLDPKQVEFYQKEKLIMVDESDKVLGPISKGEAHVIDVVRKSIYHRALSLLIFDEDDRFLLTQRASCKITFPEYFTNACCSHPLYEPSELEDSDDAIGVKRATIRRANYELGTKVEDIQCDELKFVNKLAYRAESDGGQWGEAEIDYIFVLRKNLELNLNSEEVKSHRYVTKKEMQDILLNHKEYNMKITPWVKLLARDYLFSYWDNLHQLDKIAQPKSIAYHRDLLTCL